MPTHESTKVFVESLWTIFTEEERTSRLLTEAVHDSLPDVSTWPEFSTEVPFLTFNRIWVNMSLSWILLDTLTYPSRFPKTAGEPLELLAALSVYVFSSLKKEFVRLTSATQSDKLILLLTLKFLYLLPERRLGLTCGKKEKFDHCRAYLKHLISRLEYGLSHRSILRLDVWISDCRFWWHTFSKNSGMRTCQVEANVDGDMMVLRAKGNL
jgi:hypothetical protein